ncbi:MAG: nicotinate phosphoribosyltransferase [Alphaproteobacteria bacterium]|nr:nicotinate phosphoribosyltransferase [Alphaproteobacteria bacterium]
MALDINPATIPERTDAYFLRTKEMVARYGDSTVTYVVFMRRPVVFTPRLAVDFLTGIAAARGFEVRIDLAANEGEWVGAGQPLFYYTGSLYHLVDLETQLLQRVGPPCVAAYNAYTMCSELPKVAFLAMDARHCAGAEMAEMMAYAASVGSEAARRDHGSVGFIGNATTATAGWFGQSRGLGTMPHAFVGYAGSTLRAAELYRETFPENDLIVLVDYFAREITDALEVARAFPDLASAGRIAVRMDTHGGRFVEGLDTNRSYAVLAAFAPLAIRGYRTEAELRHLVGTGVSAAAIWHLRDQLNQAGFDRVRIIGSSGFGPEKCRMMAVAEAPVDVIGTGSYLPTQWTETYATADIIEYNGTARVKVGREFLLRG